MNVMVGGKFLSAGYDGYTFLFRIRIFYNFLSEFEKFIQVIVENPAPFFFL
jgi:hypothetical protein